MKVIHLMSGVSGSGKSYYLDHTIVANADNRILHRDDVRAQLRTLHNTDKYFPVPAAEEYDAWIVACVSVIIAHPDASHYWFDQTTLSNGAAAKFYNALGETLYLAGLDICDFIFSVEILNTPYETCVERNAQRTGFAHVPENTLRHMGPAPKITSALRKQLAARYTNGAKLQLHYILEEERRTI